VTEAENLRGQGMGNRSQVMEILQELLMY
jgi:hypothetical protein